LALPSLLPIQVLSPNHHPAVVCEAEKMGKLYKNLFGHLYGIDIIKNFSTNLNKVVFLFIIDI